MKPEKVPSDWRRVVGMMLFIVAGVLLCFAGDHAYRGVQKRETWSRVQGVALRLDAKTDAASESGTSYRATFAFTDPATGKQHIVQSKLGTDLPRFRIGERVEMLYPEGEPQRAVPNTIADIFHPAIGLGIGAVVLLIFGLSLRRVRVTSAPEPGEPLMDTHISINGRRAFLPRGCISRLFSFPRQKK